jgi:hypothetical protein
MRHRTRHKMSDRMRRILVGVITVLICGAMIYAAFVA